jgi:rod shape-determining protein MreC
MLPYGAETESAGGRRQVGVALVFLVVAFATTYLPDGAQQRLASVLRSTVLRPFVATQQALAEARQRASDVERLQARLDSLSAMLSTQQALVSENETLRELLELGERVGPAYRAASLLRPGTEGSESMFLLFLGSEDGVREGAPVVNHEGLVGVIREVRPHTSVGMDWTHPDFRASAMVLDGSAYGIVENRRAAFREADRLVLTGGAYHESIPDGTLVLTSGLGRLPRGIPIGRVDGVAEVQAQWRKSYWLRAMVRPAAATHVLVQVAQGSADDLSRLFMADSTAPAPSGPDSAGVARRDRLTVLADSVRLLRSLLEERRDGGGR